MAFGGFNGQSNSGGGGGGFKQPKPGLQVARIYRIIDLGTQDDTYEGKPKRNRKMMVFWELGEKMEDGRPFSINKEYTVSLGEKSTLRKHMESWTSKTMTKEIVDTFDPARMMLGKACQVNLVLKGEKVRVDGILPLGAGQPKPEPVNPKTILDLEAFDRAVFEALPDWIKNKIMASPEYKKLSEAGAGAEDGGTPAGLDADDIPF